MNFTLKFLVITIVLFGLIVGFFEYATNRNKEHFRGARNVCERECIQDSGGPNFCRTLCEHHPGHYP